MTQICLVTKSWRYSAGWIAQMLAQAIAEQGAKIAFVAPLAEPASREPLHANLVRFRTPRELVGAHGRVARAIASLKRIASGIFNVLRLRMTTKSFIFTIPEPLLFTLPLFAMLRASGGRVIYIVHDAEPHAWSLPPWLRVVERGAHRWAYRLATVIATLTPSVADALHSGFGVPRSKLAVVPHGPLVVGDIAPLPGSRKLLIFGSLRRNKGVLDVIRGVLLSRRNGVPVQLVLAGEPLKQEAGYWDECMSAISEDPDGFDVRVGFVADDDLPGLIEEVDAFVLAYRDFDSQSGVGVLAVLAGRPVVGTRAGGLGELFDLGMVGIALPDGVTVQELSEAFQSFYSYDESYWRAEAAAGKQKIERTLRWDAIADQYIAIARGVGA